MSTPHDGPGDGRTRSTGVSSRVLRAVMRPALRRAGRGYLAGPSLDDAAVAVTRLGQAGAGAVVSYWQGDCEPRATVALRWRETISRLGTSPYGCQLALKVPGLQFDDTLIGPLTEQSRACSMRVWFDSHGHAMATSTLELAARAADRGVDVGVAIPARWMRSCDDVAAAVGRGHAIRLVKGQLPGPGSPARDVRAAFLALIDLCAGNARHVAVATHDAELLGESLRRLCDAGTPCEAQLLLGLPFRAPLVVARALGVPVRFYVAYGHPSLVYSPQTLWENRRIALWLAQDMVLPRGRRIRSSLAALDAAKPWASDGAG